VNRRFYYGATGIRHPGNSLFVSAARIVLRQRYTVSERLTLNACRYESRCRQTYNANYYMLYCRL